MINNLKDYRRAQALAERITRTMKTENPYESPDDIAATKPENLKMIVNDPLSMIENLVSYIEQLQDEFL